MQTINAQPTPAAAPMSREDNKNLVQTLVSSKIFRDYERAFSNATGMPISFRPVESWQLPNHGKRNENGLCALLAEKSRSCAACLQVQQQLSDNAKERAHTVTCQLGLCDTAVPVHMGQRLIGFLQTGQVFRRAPTQGQFNKTAKLVAEWGISVGRDHLKRVYFNSKVLPPKQYEAMIELLSTFAQHVSLISNQIVLSQSNSEPPVIARAKAFIAENQAEDITLGQVAKAVNTSTFYFCKIFKKVTGINFTDYVSRVRIEKAKNLLLNPNLRISEIAYAVGFQSLTHFNRVFKRISGNSPTDYRTNLARN
jgi:AraC-like DNA-binding protein/ligand-binding sensor protein